MSKDGLHWYIGIFVEDIFRELTWKDQNEGKNWYTNDLDLFIKQFKFDGTGRKGDDRKLYYCLTFYNVNWSSL